MEDLSARAIPDTTSIIIVNPNVAVRVLFNRRATEAVIEFETNDGQVSNVGTDGVILAAGENQPAGQGIARTLQKPRARTERADLFLQVAVAPTTVNITQNSRFDT